MTGSALLLAFCCVLCCLQSQKSADEEGKGIVAVEKRKQQQHSAGGKRRSNHSHRHHHQDHSDSKHKSTRGSAVKRIAVKSVGGGSRDSEAESKSMGRSKGGAKGKSKGMKLDLNRGASPVLPSGGSSGGRGTPTFRGAEPLSPMRTTGISNKRGKRRDSTHREELEDLDEVLKGGGNLEYSRIGMEGEAKSKKKNKQGGADVMEIFHDA